MTIGNTARHGNRVVTVLEIDGRFVKVKRKAKPYWLKLADIVPYNREAEREKKRAEYTALRIQEVRKIVGAEGGRYDTQNQKWIPRHWMIAAGYAWCVNTWVLRSRMEPPKRISYEPEQGRTDE